jgi:hypothetical protein
LVPARKEDGAFSRSRNEAKEVKEVKGSAHSLAEMPHNPEEEREDDAEKQAGDDREVESSVFAAMDDVAG